MTKRLHWLPAAIWGAMIFWFSSQSQPPGGHLGPDYLLHFLAFGLFSVAVLWGITGGMDVRPNPPRALLAWIISLAYGCLDEFHQSFVPGRTATLQDLIADALGALFFVIGACILLNFRSTT